MARNPLTRFVANIGGPRRLFTVREASRGLLIIKTDAHNSVSTNDGQISEILTFKHSVHTSERSETAANLVHLTQEFANGTTKEAHLLTHAVRDGTFAPIYQKLVPDPRNTPVLVPHKKDTIISLGEFDPDRTSLVYGIWLSSRGAPKIQANPDYSVIVAKFQLFSLIIAYGFVDMPATTMGTMLHYATTSADRLTAVEKRLGYLTGITPGADAVELPAYIIHELNAVIELRQKGAFGIELMQQQRLGKSRPPMFTAQPPGN